MVIHKTDDFLRAVSRLPKGIQDLFKRQERIFQGNWLDPRLHTKRVKELPGAYSFRITRRYRAFFYWKDEEAVFFTIGHRKDVYG
jgi:mRNA-degrading endonuclease RelE of RelBE toxin-antitoxin system